jgi:L-2-hydroxyglutarate oxidase
MRFGEKNGLRDLRLLNAGQMREIQPHVGGVAALHVPEEGIVDYAAVCQALVQEIQNLDGKIITSARMTKLRRIQGGWSAETTAGAFEGGFLVNCSGLHCDRVSHLAGEKRDVRIVPFRGEYYKLRPGREHLVRNLIYPVPDQPFLAWACTSPA